MENEVKLSRKQKLLKAYQSYGIIVIILLEILLFSLLSKSFFTVGNLLNVGRQISFIGISGVGLALVIIAGGIDISTGTMLALSGVICAKLSADLGLPLGVAIILTLIVSMLFGIASGEVTTRLKVPALITTLAFQVVYKGVAYIITDAVPIYGIPSSFKFLGQGYIFGIIPVPLIVFILIILLGNWFMSRTFVGRHIYAVGGNDEAAHLSGINVKRIRILGFAVCSTLTAVAGILMAGRLGSGQPGTGAGFEMDVITACVLGGIDINGGKGSILHVAIGALIMGILSNGMMLIGLNEYTQWIAKGVVLMFAVAVSSLEIKGSK